MLRFILNIFIFIILTFYISSGFAENAEPFTINAVISKNKIEFVPNTIPENTPFIIHVINNTNTPVELENTDTSVEIYANMDKTFKVGLSAGDYIFFNDFNPGSAKAILFVKTASTIKNAGTSKQSYLKGKTNSEQIFLNNNTASKQVFLNSNATSSQVFNNTSSSHVNLSEILFVIWRESVEALLVVGVVYNWLKQLESGRRSGFVFLWLGVIIGLLCSFLLSFLLINISHFLSPHFASLFQASMTLLAATMIIYMVKWMRENGRTLKTSMHQSLEKKSSHRLRNISILTVVSIAFAREASEASIFIYALSIGNNHISSITMLSLLLFGILLALGTIYLLQLGNKIFSWRFFFKCTEILLLLLGGGLLLNCVDSLIVSGFLTPLYKNVWNTSFLISEGGIISPILSSFTGYRATPSLMDIIAYSLYWLVIYFLLRAKKVSTCNIN